MTPAGANPGLGPTGFTPLLLGTSLAQHVRLPAGRWDVSFQYQSPTDLTVSAPGLSMRLPANLDPPGPFWSAGTITSDGGATAVSVAADSMSRLARPEWASLGVFALTRVDVPQRVVPLSAACNRYVDWYALER